MSHPPDLPDLLRIACAQGKCRLNVFFSPATGYTANLANTGDGWTTHPDRDPLLAITEVLRIRYGRMLERQRAGLSTDGLVHPAHGAPVQLDLEDAIARVAPVDVDGLIG